MSRLKGSVPQAQKRRVLFLTKDRTVLHEGSPTFQRITDLRDHFDEIHIILLDLKPAKDTGDTFRFFTNVWVYTTHSSSWWRRALDAYRLAKAQLFFGGSFRVDVIVVEDPFESGFAGIFLGRKYNVPVQLHVHGDEFVSEYTDTLRHPDMYTWCRKFVVKRVDTVRVENEYQERLVLEFSPMLKTDVRVLPRYYDVHLWQNLKPSINLRERYPQFETLLLHVSPMTNSAYSSNVLTAAAPVLRAYPKAGLIVLGNGPLRSQLERQVISFGLQNQIMFEPMPEEVISHMKSTDALIHLSQKSDEEDIALSAGALALPMLLSSGGNNEKLFEQGVSACLCEPSNVECLTTHLKSLAGNSVFRTHMGEAARSAVLKEVSGDRERYLHAYADSIEKFVEKRKS